MITLEARAPCPVDGYLLRWFAFPSVRVNKRSLRQLPGFSLRCQPGPCPECGLALWSTSLPSTHLVTVWRLTADSQREVDAYRARRWPELVAA